MFATWAVGKGGQSLVVSWAVEHLATVQEEVDTVDRLGLGHGYHWPAHLKSLRSFNSLAPVWWCLGFHLFVDSGTQILDHLSEHQNLIVPWVRLLLFPLCLICLLVILISKGWLSVVAHHKLFGALNLAFLNLVWLLLLIFFGVFLRFSRAILKAWDLSRWCTSRPLMQLWPKEVHCRSQFVFLVE